jgi:hypothetical protein
LLNCLNPNKKIINTFYTNQYSDTNLNEFTPILDQYEQNYDFNSYLLTKTVFSILAEGTKITGELDEGDQDYSNISSYVLVQELNEVLVPLFTKNTNKVRYYNHLLKSKPLTTVKFILSDISPLDCRIINKNLNENKFSKDGLFNNYTPIIDDSQNLVKQEVSNYSQWLLNQNDNPPDSTKLIDYNKAIEFYQINNMLGQTQPQMYFTTPNQHDFIIKVVIKTNPNIDITLAFRNYYEINYNAGLANNNIQPIYFSNEEINYYKAFNEISKYFSGMSTTNLCNQSGENDANNIFSKIVKKIKDKGSKVLKEVGLDTEDLIKTAITTLIT